MNPHDDLEPETDRALDELLDAASDEAESGSFRRPPFAGVLGRARRIDPGLRSPEPAVAQDRGQSRDDATLIAALALFVEAARAEAEIDMATEERRVPPGLPRRGGPRVARWVIVGGVLAAAASIVLLVGLLDARNALRSDTLRDDNSAMDQADHERRILEAETGGNELPGVARAPKTRHRATASTKIPEVELLEPEYVLPEEAIPLDEAPAAIPEPAADPPEPAATTSIASRRARKDRALRRLDDEAQARLSAGDSAGAEKAYRALVRMGGRKGLAELAYGDLFTLAHGRRDTQELRTLWGQYLKKFPRGRFADDARAGLCRHASESGRDHCWERYLDDFPTGAYHRQAARALSRGKDSARGDPHE